MVPTAGEVSSSKAGERIIVALDVETAGEALSIANELRGRVAAFKIGLQLFTAAGPGLVEKMVAAGSRVFLDLKYHDIPNTVAKASVEAARLGVWMFNVHAGGGGEMMRTAFAEMSDACTRESLARPMMIGVTVLTSSSVLTLEETGVAGDVEDQVVRLARLAAECGLDGVVASPLEIEPIRQSAASNGFVIVTPGIRPAPATNDDQKRVTSPATALAAGADYLVIGRPITANPHRSAALGEIVRAIEETEETN